jgi:hypothetical protein
MKVTIALMLLLTFGAAVSCDPVVHRFELWGTLSRRDKGNFYFGWLNGFLAARGEPGVRFLDCLETLTYDQAIAMIDKRFKDHPEKWSSLITPEILEALTVPGSACEGKNPFESK